MAPSATPKFDKPDDHNPNLPALDIIDHTTFEQILEMDDDGDRDFSKSIVYGFFEQAETTFVKMETAITEHDLDELSNLGHFLKGSSATLGITHVKDGCEKIQNFGAKKDESGTVDEPSESKALENIAKTLKEVKKDYDDAAKELKHFYGDEKK
ncbi:hypothetical protein AJ80_00999 [Polytolypa hystricis UAMH7299]|uniref:HPt domain-containing protein n=1 Tax=Polytolypa hystricis (strain UAMH7299) TaxID=1447883 RepID=A0A2B7Z224_POLH7|nr:hypothetical protein AJ80_00999 [Polytolypa hystricis UAMH7299]